MSKLTLAVTVFAIFIVGTAIFFGSIQICITERHAAALAKSSWFHSYSFKAVEKLTGIVNE
jgi:hypothetical protein